MKVHGQSGGTTQIRRSINRNLSFIKLMKDKARKNLGGNVLHKANEGQSKEELKWKCPS